MKIIKLLLALHLSCDIFGLISGGTYAADLVVSSAPKSSNALLNRHADSLYNNCHLAQYGLTKDLFMKTLVGYYNLKSKNPSIKPIISIVDFDKPSTEKRLWIIDLANHRVLFHTLVAHGRNSGENYSVNFSNNPNSLMSSLGFYKTGNTYMGKHGLSLMIEGLDKNINCNAKSRSIVIHGADYVSEDYIKCNGRLGRSHGCPAVPASEHKQIIEAIEGGSLLFISRTGIKYNSDLLKKQTAADYIYKTSLN